MDVQTTLNYYGRTEEAVRFYCRTIEAETLFMMRFRDCPDPSHSRPGMEEKIFHATFRIGSTEIMASDCGCQKPPTGITFTGFALAIRVETPEKAERFFAALSDGGQIQIPLLQTFFAERYGIVIDRFGISWKIMVESKAQTEIKNEGDVAHHTAEPAEWAPVSPNQPAACELSSREKPG